jgi:hypothetical protein
MFATYDSKHATNDDSVPAAVTLLQEAYCQRPTPLGPFKSLGTQLSSSGHNSVSGHTPDWLAPCPHPQVISMECAAVRPSL